MHFAPTTESKVNLIKSGVNGIIEVTGNTVIDALYMISKKDIIPKFFGLDWNKKVIFVSVHRRENWGKRLLNIIEGINMILQKYKNIIVLLPLHPNPIVRKTLLDSFEKNPNVILTEPLNYLELVGTIKNCFVLLTDSEACKKRFS